MRTWEMTVDAKKNSIAELGGEGGTPAVVPFNPSLQYGDVLTVETEITNTWNSGGGPLLTNADGVPVTIDPDTHEVTFRWDEYNPSNSPYQNKYPGALKAKFGVGCLVGSLDGGATFFAIGTRFSMMYLGGAGDPPTELQMFYWDVNTGDNSGSIAFTVRLTSPTAP